MQKIEELISKSCSELEEMSHPQYFLFNSKDERLIVIWVQIPHLYCGFLFLSNSFSLVVKQLNLDIGIWGESLI